ncbi:uncharacterized protein ACA1_273480 [Acanthamoeba castellanii str. Neff]|uniref:Uncharacterized protein n=1 Tax=Acanthamoeba castellanii (strain ATCC 30010 / Neff) TaxID=1257118 RepID=L8GFS6_ACACF|nr:uncharacterized protein ACA1_273480 [Acanthamoeba castellanii str. Neff]ELR11857.1 hypothetical protein ACA1_273480 [Acanthamoeba castellanii str. Neff]
MGKQSGRLAKKAKPTLSKGCSASKDSHIFEVGMTKQKNPHQAIKTLARSAGKGFVSEAHKQGVMFSWDKG